MTLNFSSMIFIAGHSGMVGSAITSRLKKEGYQNLIVRSSKELDLTDQGAVFDFFAQEKPTIVIDAAARVGGILANDRYPWQFIYDNLQMQNNLISASHQNDVDQFIFLGSSCIYPKLAEQPLKEDYLLTGPLEPTNQWYALAKIAGVQMVEALRKQYGRNYVSLMPTNLYGPNDNFDLETSHVLPALLRKFHEAKEKGDDSVTIWGSGSPMREFLHVDDVASAVHFVLGKQMKYNLYNVGVGKDISISKLAQLIQEVVGYNGQIEWDHSKPDGTPRKLMDVSRMSQEGWNFRIGLREGIEKTYRWFVDHYDHIKEVEIKS